MELFTPEPGLMIWTVIMFGLLLLVLGSVGLKPILGIIKKREDDIRHSIDEAERVRNEADELFENYKKQLDDSRLEAQKVIEQGKKVGKSVGEEITAKASEEARLIFERAQAEIEREKERALADLQAKVADLTILATAKVFKDGLDPDKQRKLVEQAIAEVKQVGQA
ncbi:MAG: F0F1 ATP synthase subunit B [Actinomycetota bacterium]